MPALAEDDFDLENLEVTGGEDEVDAGALARDDVEDAPIVRFVNKVMLDAIKKGASDIHFEPYEKIYRVRQRIDGVLKEVARAAGAARAEDLARASRSWRGSTSPSGASRRTAASRCACPRTARSTFASAPARRCSARRPCMRILDPSSAMLGIECARLRAVPEGPVPQVPEEAAGHDPGHRADGLAARPSRCTPASTSSTSRTPTSRRPRIRRKSSCRASTR